MEFEKVRVDLEEIKYIFKNPRIYLTTFFSDLLHEVDLECEKHFQKTKSNSTLEAQITITNKLNQFEQSCLQRFPTNNFQNETFQNEFAELMSAIDAQNDLQLLDEMIYECLIKIEQEIFLNKGVVFLPGESFLVNELNFGICVFVKDEFIGKRERNVLRFFLY